MFIFFFPDMLTPRSMAASVAHGKYIYIIGGYNSSTDLQSVERYIPHVSTQEEGGREEEREGRREGWVGGRELHQAQYQIMAFNITTIFYASLQI